MTHMQTQVNRSGSSLKMPWNWLCQAAGIAPRGVTAQPAQGGLGLPRNWLCQAAGIAPRGVNHA